MTSQSRFARPGAIVDLVMGLTWLGFAVYGVIAGIDQVWALPVWGLASGLHLGGVLRSQP